MWMAHLAIASMAIGTSFADDAVVEKGPTKIGAWIDVGQLWKATNDYESSMNRQILNRSKISLAQIATVNENLTLAGAVGGLFFYSLPADPGAAHTRLIKFTAVIEEASGHYKWGDPDEPSYEAKFGLFFNKYNASSKNLGEYLWRSTTYPANGRILHH